MLKFILRILLIAIGFVLILPAVTGVSFRGDPFTALFTSLVFNLMYFGLEWLLAVIAFGINIGTLGLGVIITSGLRFVAGLIAPSVALFGTSQLLPGLLKIYSLFPGAVVGGLALGSVLWATQNPAKSGRK